MEAVRAVWARALGTTRACLLELPARAAPELTGLSDMASVEIALSAQVHSVLSDLADAQ